MIPSQLQQEDFRFILIKKREKVPIETSWQETNNYSHDDPKLQNHIKGGGNYGVVTGRGNLVVVDFDNKNVQTKVMPKLPQTFTVRTGSGFYHKYFIVDMPENFKVQTEEHDTLADIQGPKKQVIGPGSTHPNGNKYLVKDDLPIATVSMGQIKAVFGEYLVKKETQPTRDTKYAKDDTVQEIKRKKSVIQQLAHYGVDTTKNPTGCPFHSSKGGQCLSFKDDVWHCFHCEKGGDVFTLVMEKERTSFVPAKRILAEELGLQIKKTVIQKRKEGGFMDDARNFYTNQPFFFDTAQLFWLWNNTRKCWQVRDETDLLNALDHQLDLQDSIVNNSLKSNYINALRQVGRKNIPAPLPKTCVQFRTKIFDIETKESYESTPDLFACNPLPWDIGESSDTPVMDGLFKDWVGDNAILLYEILAYCCLIDYPIHRIFGLVGNGCNGKSTFLTVVQKFVGSENICSTELDLLTTNRFETSKIHKKLVAIMGETNFSSIDKTSMLKKLVGQDLVNFEFKNKNPFSDVNYGKLLVATNQLPASEDTSQGWFRRWIILNFDNEFEEGKDVVKTIPDAEFSNLARKVVDILPRILGGSGFTNDGSIAVRQERYELASNPFIGFAKEWCEEDVNHESTYSELYLAYTQYLKRKKKRHVTSKFFSRLVASMGFEMRRTTFDGANAMYIFGIRLCSNWRVL